MSKKPAKKASKKAASKSAPGRAKASTRKSATKVAKKPAAKAAGKPASPKPAARRSGAGSAKKAGRGAPAASAPSNAMALRAGTLVRFAHKMVADMIWGIPDEQACAQVPGAVNHKLWTMGHLAQSNQWFASLIDGQPITVPAEWDKLFGMGSQPTGDPAAYPPIADVRAAFEVSNERLCAAIESLDDVEIIGPPAGDGGGFVHDKLDSALKAAWHDGWHLGQIAGLRKGLGLPGMRGG